MDKVTFVRADGGILISAVELLAYAIWYEHYIPIVGVKQVRYMLEKFQSSEALLSQIDGGYSYYLMQNQNRDLLGYLGFQFREKELFLSKFYIVAENRGKGYGRQAMRFLERIAFKNGVAKITLTVNKNNQGSIKAYEAFGFSVKGPFIQDIGNGFCMDDYIMEKVFGSVSLSALSLRRAILVLRFSVKNIFFALKRLASRCFEYAHVWQLWRKIKDMQYPDKDVTVPLQGLRILVRNPRRNVLVGRTIYSTQFWEEKVTRFILPKIKPGMTVVDVGADIGYYTMLFARAVGPSGRVLAFEPIPKAREYLEANIKLNSFTNIKVLDFALLDQKGSFCLEKPFLKSRLSLQKHAFTEDDLSVQTQIFDEWHAGENNGRIDLIKIDVEGAELHVLRGMKQVLEKQHPALLVEVHPKFMKMFDAAFTDMLILLFSLNYTCRCVEISQGNLHVFFYEREG